MKSMTGQTIRFRPDRSDHMTEARQTARALSALHRKRGRLRQQMRIALRHALLADRIDPLLTLPSAHLRRTIRILTRALERKA